MYLPVNRDVLVQVGGEEAKRTVVEVGGQRSTGLHDDGGLHDVLDVLITGQIKLILARDGDKKSGNKKDKLEHGAGLLCAHHAAGQNGPAKSVICKANSHTSTRITGKVINRPRKTQAGWKRGWDMWWMEVRENN